MHFAVPDLAFSESNFLNTSRQKATEVTERTTIEETRKGRKAKKAADTEAEISRYFTAGKAKEAGNAGAIGDSRRST